MNDLLSKLLYLSKESDFKIIQKATYGAIRRQTLKKKYKLLKNIK